MELSLPSRALVLYPWCVSQKLDLIWLVSLLSCITVSTTKQEGFLIRRAMTGELLPKELVEITYINEAGVVCEGNDLSCAELHPGFQRRMLAFNPNVARVVIDGNYLNLVEPNICTLNDMITVLHDLFGGIMHPMVLVEFIALSSELIVRAYLPEQTIVGSSRVHLPVADDVNPAYLNMACRVLGKLCSQIVSQKHCRCEIIFTATLDRHLHHVHEGPFHFIVETDQGAEVNIAYKVNKSPTIESL